MRLANLGERGLLLALGGPESFSREPFVTLELMPDNGGEVWVRWEAIGVQCRKFAPDADSPSRHLTYSVVQVPDVGRRMACAPSATTPRPPLRPG